MAGPKAKKGGFMTPARKNKLKTLLRKKAQEELKIIQEKKAAEKAETVKVRLGEPKPVEGLGDADIVEICREYYERIVKLTGENYDIMYNIRHRDLKINDLSFAVNDMRGKFVKPPLKKVTKFGFAKFAKLMKAAKKAETEALKNKLKAAEKPKYTLEEEEPKKAAPEWAQK